MSGNSFLEESVLDYRPRIGAGAKLGIGIVGSGGWVRRSQLPAYQKAGFNVVAITSRTRAHAEDVAAQFEIPRVCDSVADLASLPEVAVVDIIGPPAHQVEVVREVAAHGKHIMCHKPIALTLEDAWTIVETARATGVKLAVNHNGRWDPALRAARSLVRSGYLGQPLSAEFRVGILTEPLQLHNWWVGEDKGTLLYDSIHLIDAYRFLFGEPRRIYVSPSRLPHAADRRETAYYAILEWDNGMHGCITHTWRNRAGDDHGDYRIEGTDGILKGTLGLWSDRERFPEDTMAVWSRKLGDGWMPIGLEGRWFIEGMIGTMAELLDAVATNREASINGMEGLRTLYLVLAGYQSASLKRPVDLDFTRCALESGSR